MKQNPAEQITPASASAHPDAFVPNPNAFMVRVGSFVTCSISKRRIRVADRGAHGQVWELIDQNHPSLHRNGGFLVDGSLRYIGTHYLEYEPQYISRERYASLFAAPDPQQRDAAHDGAPPASSSATPTSAP